MQCPRCSVTISPERIRSNPFNDQGESLDASTWTCPNCRRAFVTLSRWVYQGGDTRSKQIPSEVFVEEADMAVIWPRVSSRPPVPSEIPEEHASLAREAGLILADSPRASAALARRCLQQLLRENAGAPPGNLHSEIDWAIANSDLPSHAKESLHDLRRIGNFAAHPNKSTATGDYLAVEPGEAEWTLDVLDALFDHYFVGPAKAAKRKADLAAKLGGA